MKRGRKSWRKKNEEDRFNVKGKNEEKKVEKNVDKRMDGNGKVGKEERL